ncbi:hypothetical protein GOALK_120_00110 [Gordonia alkanivorans NBRC 16433]|uniref:Uncharacterized protein n=1 Tax=Gordonia alkanivorans NBRC 16433 TaxID=1027371 RepID=F9W265_9ACTN|nr:hypothetical protein GOALK_120_00110 [Gordonia alkanivorans NBRC 16433]
MLQRDRHRATARRLGDAEAFAEGWARFAVAREFGVTVPVAGQYLLHDFKFVEGGSARFLRQAIPVRAERRSDWRYIAIDHDSHLGEFGPIDVQGIADAGAEVYAGR